MDEQGKIPFDLLTRHFAGYSNVEEKNKLEAWTAASEINRKEYKLAEKIYNSDMENAFIPNTEKALNKVLKKLPEQKKPAFKFGLKWVGIAAALIIGIGLAYTGLRYIRSNDNELLSYVNEKYDKVVVTLPDDSNIWLRKGSELYYPKKFKGKKRKVKFSGEGYFEIESDSDHPFEIEAKNTITRVLGTKFSLNTKTADSSIVLILDEGLVSFETQSSDKIEVEAGEKLKFDRKIRYVEISRNMEQNHSAWKTQILTFKNEMLKTIILDMENHYHINFADVPENMAIEKYSFTLDNIGSADEAIEMLEMQLDISIAKEGDFYYLEPNL